MADLVVSTLVKDVLGRLTSLAIQEYGLLRRLKDNILSLKEDFDQIQGVLQDAQEKHNKQKAVEVWLKSLKSASLMVENVLDEVSTEALLQRLHKQTVKYRVRAFFSSNHNHQMSRVRIAHKVQAIRAKLDVIASKRFNLNLTTSCDISHVDVGLEGKMPDRETSSLIHDSSINIYGRNEEMEAITNKICNQIIEKHDDDTIRVFGIWGMGGVGKTTLAQLVYNHQKVNKCFELKCWTYVSENFQIKEIIKGIITSIDKHECTLTHLDVLQESLRNKLRGKKFLIVLDDVWIEEGEKTKWDRLSETLSCGKEGSMVVMTTRSQTTSRMMAKGSKLQHNLGCLSEEDSWLLFKKLAFAEGRDGDHISELEPIGRKIVEKCKGLPLAVNTLGSLMWSKRSTSEWERVKDSNIWEELPENNIFPALKLSYDNLPPHLRRCFAYCCLFPKGYELKKDELIPLWVSNGFIPSRGETDLYVLGEEIFNCLVWRSFISKVNSLWVDRYIMHDLMHDMAQHMMGDDCLIIEPGKEVMIPNEVLHLSSSCPIHFSPEDSENLSSLRSIFMLGYECKFDIHQVINNVYLRVLYLVGITLNTLPESICKLKYLKYLNLSDSNIEVLPESIIYLQNLQVLLLYRCHELWKLPKGLRYMSNLQQLNTDNCSSLWQLPAGIKELTSLRTLSRFPVGTKDGAKIGELGDLNLLAGELKISQLDNVRGLSEAKSANLICKKHLSILELEWSGFPSTMETITCNEEVLDGLEPNPCLKTLTINKFFGKIISPSWMVKLRNLANIFLIHCYICEYIPTLGRLPNLRSIELFHMDSLKSFHEDDRNMTRDTSNMFLCLEDLRIANCPNLVSLPSNLPKLKVLTLQDCDGLLSLPDEIQSFKDLNKLVIDRCYYLSKRCEKDVGVDWPKISHIPNIYFDPISYFQNFNEEEEEEEEEDEIREI